MSEATANAIQNTEDNKASAKRPKAQREGAKSSGRQQAKGRATQRQLPVQFNVHATVVQKRLKIGDARLASTVFRHWNGIHQSLHYLTDFSRTSLKGKVVSAANRGINTYLAERIEFAHEMMRVATDMADQNGVVIGEPGRVKEDVVLIATQIEVDVLELIKLLDDYVIVMDSLWLAKVIEMDKRDEAHNEICRTVNVLHLLLTKMRGKMIDYRHHKLDDRLTKDEEAYARDLENLTLDVTGLNIQAIREAEEKIEQEAKRNSKAARKAEAGKTIEGTGAVESLGEAVDQQAIKQDGNDPEPQSQEVAPSGRKAAGKQAKAAEAVTA